MTPAMAAKMVGVGSQYAVNATDKDGDYPDGSRTYRLNIPEDAPARDLWSMVDHDPRTRPELQTSSEISEQEQQARQVNGEQGWLS